MTHSVQISTPLAHGMRSVFLPAMPTEMNLHSGVAFNLACNHEFPSAMDEILGYALIV